MPSIPDGAHIAYSATSQEFALPPEYISIMIASAQSAGPEPVVKQIVDSANKRTVDGPVKTDTAQYWCDLDCLMYSEQNNNVAVDYDREKCVLGLASDIVPDMIRLPNQPHGVLSILKGSTRIDESVPYLGFAQPGKHLFDAKVVLSERRPYAGGTLELYTIPSTSRVYQLRRDNRGHVVALTAYARYDKRIVMDEYQFADYRKLGDIQLPGKVTRLQMGWCRDKNNRLMKFPKMKVVYQVNSATLGPIPRAFFALSTVRMHTQIEDSRYEIPGSGRHMIVYNYKTPNLSIDDASRAAYQGLLRESDATHGAHQWTVDVLRCVCLFVLLLFLGHTALRFIRKTASK